MAYPFNAQTPNPAWPAVQPNRYINDNRIYVQGEAGANSYPIGPATVVQLMDNEKPYFYIKSSDINGVIQPIRRFRYEEEIPEPAKPDPEYVTKEDLDKKFSELMSAINRQQHYNKKGDNRNESSN